MRSKGLIQCDSAFAGHSLRVYSALASITDVLPISSFVDVVFYRGITMQSAVERDSQNRSNYAMCAVNPSRISKTFNEAALREVVEIVGRRTDALLEIVNHNVKVCISLLVTLHQLTPFSRDRNTSWRATLWRCKLSQLFSRRKILTSRRHDSFSFIVLSNTDKLCP